MNAKRARRGWLGLGSDQPRETSRYLPNNGRFSYAKPLLRKRMEECHLVRESIVSATEVCL